MNGSCGRMGYDVRVVSRLALGGIIRRRDPSCASDAPRGARASCTRSPTRDAPDAELARELGAAGGQRDRAGQAGARRARGARRPTAEPGSEADALVARAAGGRRRGRAGGRLRAGARGATRRAGTSRRSTRAGAASWRASCARACELPRRGRGAQLVAAIGPCIGPCCFEVGRDVAGDREAAAFVVAPSGATRPTSTCGRRCGRSSRRSASRRGDRGRRRAARSTSRERFHSFRRDGATAGGCWPPSAARGRRAGLADRRCTYPSAP